ncbi:unnamed protein product [Diamesa hyperborea]
MFFIQACRGDKIDTGVVESDSVDPVSKKITIPQFADLLVMYSTFALHFSFRNTLKGSWFIQALCQELNAEKFKTNLEDDLLTILTKVNKNVGTQMTNFESTLTKPLNVAFGKYPESNKIKQMPIIVSMLTKQLYLTT